MTDVLREPVLAFESRKFTRSFNYLTFFKTRFHYVAHDILKLTEIHLSLCFCLLSAAKPYPALSSTFLSIDDLLFHLVLVLYECFCLNAYMPEEVRIEASDALELE